MTNNATTAPQHSRGYVSSSDSEYARRRRQHMTLINQLRSIGAQADLDLPRIAVIGNQSAGKSSLVDAISGISVPRDAGTCTRCPMECRLTSAGDSWSCQVSIRWEFENDGKPRNKVQEETFGPLITHKGEVELYLRRAQAAVLNPSTEPTRFLSKSAADLKSSGRELKFSRNTVCVQLSGPELTDLAFVDLPGIIQNEQPDIIKLVEDLVASCIKGNTLTLVTLPMSDDIENQKAARMAQDADPSGQRTIGVMTKPDTIAKGAIKVRDNWLEVIEGRRHQTKHGYFCTRQPDDEERSKGITPAGAREAEQKFFRDTAPWSSSSCPERFGTENLIANLSKLLARIIDESLPKIQNEVATQLENCNSELSTLPPPITTDPASYVLTLVTEYSQAVARHVKGGESHAAALVQANRRTYEQYKFDIRASAPAFMPYTNVSEASQDFQQYLKIDDEDEDPTTSSTRSEKHLYLEDVHSHIERSLARELPNNVPYSSKISLIEDFQQSWEASTQKCFDAVQAKFDETLRLLYTQEFGRYDHLRALVAQGVRELLRLKQADTWTLVKTLLELEKNPYTQNGHYLQVNKDKQLAQYKKARAEANGGRPSKKSKGSSSLSATNGVAISSVSLAGAAPAQNTPTSSFFSPTTQSFFGAPKTAAAKPFFGDSMTQPVLTSPFSFAQGKAPSPPRPAPTPVPMAIPAVTTGQKRGLEDEERQQAEREALAALAKLGYHVTPADLGKLHPPDIYEEELEVMAEVRAYWRVAYKRVIDYIPMTIDKSFLFAVANALQSFLITKLGLGTPQAAKRCELYLEEDVRIVARRDELTRKKERLERVRMEVEAFGLQEA